MAADGARTESSKSKRGVKKTVAFGAPFYSGKEAGVNFALVF